MTGLCIIGVTLFFGAVFGIIGFICVCKIVWFLQALKEPLKRKTINAIDKLYRKVEGL